MALTFRTRVLSGLVVSSVVLTITGISAYIATSKITESVVNLVEHPFAVTEHLRSFGDHAESMIDLTNTAVLADTAANRRAFIKGAGDEYASALADLAEVRNRYLGPPANVADAQTAFMQLVKLRDEALALQDAHKAADAVQLLDLRADRDRVALRKTLVPIRTFANRRAATFVDASLALNQRIQRLILLLVIAGLAAAVTAGVLSTRFVLQSVKAMSGFARQIATGTMSARLPVGGTDELAQLSSNLNAMAVQLEEQDRRLRDANVTLERTVDARTAELTASNQQLRAAEQQLRASNQQLQASDQQLRAANQQWRAIGQALEERSATLQDNVMALRQRVHVRHRPIRGDGRLAHVGGRRDSILSARRGNRRCGDHVRRSCLWITRACRPGAAP